MSFLEIIGALALVVAGHERHAARRRQMSFFDSDMSNLKIAPLTKETFDDAIQHYRDVAELVPPSAHICFFGCAHLPVHPDTTEEELDRINPPGWRRWAEINEADRLRQEEGYAKVRARQQARSQNKRAG